MPNAGLCRIAAEVPGLAHSPGACGPITIRHNRRGLQAFQEAKQFIIRSEAEFLGRDRSGLLESLLLKGEVGVEIDLGGFDGLVPKPQCNHRQVYTGLQQLHCGGVSKYVRRYALGFQCRARSLSCCCVLGDQVLDGVGAESAATGIWKQDPRILLALLPNPFCDNRNGGFC